LPVQPIVDPSVAAIERQPGAVDNWQPSAWYQPWWSQMPAFVLPTLSDTHIRLNVAGRERDGMIEPDDYARACDEIERVVRACTSGRTRRTLVADVWRPRKSDPFEGGPDADLVITCSEETDAVEHPELGTVGPLPIPRTGAHTNRGFAVFAGGGISHIRGAERPMLDVPATLCALVGAGTGTLEGTPIPLREGAAVPQR
jgi:hypothetical protein